MGWRERTLRGKIGGIEYRFQSNDEEFGRRAVEHQFPQRDDVYVEDMGRSPRPFKIAGYLIGNDHLEQRDALIRVCEGPGPIKITHHYYGDLDAHCRTIKFKNTSNELGITRFEADFIRTGDLVFPESVVDHVSAITESADLTFETSRSFFDKIFEYSDLPYAFSQDVLASLDQAAELVYNSKRTMGLGAKFKGDFDLFKLESVSLALNAADLATSLYNLITFGMSGADQKQSERAIDGMFGYDPDVRNTSTNGTGAVKTLMQMLAITQLTTSITEFDFTSAGDAEESLASYLAKIDALFNTDLDVDVFNAFTDARAKVVNFIREIKLRLPEVVSHTLQEPMPALVVAYDLYGDITREDEIIDRNAVAHPGFVPSGPLEVLSE